jgi:tripartite-type tricarboxylate transporter receptor subunit TctC
MQQYSRLLAATFAVLALPVAAQAQSAENFYRGRTITLIIPTSPAGINDISGRLVSRHIGRFIPGNPNVIVQYNPGAGGLVAANRIANTIERDGATFTIMQRAVPQLAIQGDPTAKFDPLKLTWLGSLSSYEDDGYLLLVNSDHPANTALDLRKQGIVAKLGSDQPGSTNTSFAYIAKKVLGLNIDVIRGYPGAAPMFLAMQRHELDGQFIGYNSVRAGQANLWNDKLVKPLVAFGRLTRLKALPDVPTGRELTKDPKMLALIEFAELPFFMALPFVAPPQLPPEREKALQDAFMKMVADKAFLDDAGKVNIDISAIDGKAVKQLIERAVATPRDVVDLYSQMAGPDKD